MAYLINNIVRKAQFEKIYSMLISALVFFRFHVTNFEWSRFIWPYTELTKLSHKELFNDIIFTVFKPFLHVEKIAGQICGYECINYTNKIVWAVLVYLISYLIIKRLKEYFLYSKFKVLKFLSLIIIITFPFLIRSSSYGGVSDIIYTFGILLLFVASQEFLIIKNKNNLFSRKYSSTKIILFVVTGIIFVDLSRPYGIFTIIFYILFSIFNKSYKIIFASLLGLLIAMPYHVVHYNKTGNFILSNFTGCFLAEVHLPKEYVRPTQNDKSFATQLEIHKVCDKAKQDIISEYFLDNPRLALQNTVELNRLNRIIFPSAFNQYKEIPKISTRTGIYEWSISVILYVFYFSTIWIFLFNLSNSNISFLNKLIICLIVLLPLFSGIIANSGKEALRHTLHYYVPILFLSLQIGYFKIQKNNKFNIKSY
tara:strand:- start:584 stop:1858 length:1275 start_codon:yes stop_codon:yes gene_type:complete